MGEKNLLLYILFHSVYTIYKFFEMNTDISLNSTITINRTYKIVSFKIYATTIDLFNSCTIYMLVKSDEGKEMSTFYTTTQEEYLSWNNDDSFMVDLAQTKIPDLVKDFDW